MRIACMLSAVRLRRGRPPWRSETTDFAPMLSVFFREQHASSLARS
jgi:hypothetical protein